MFRGGVGGTVRGMTRTVRICLAAILAVAAITATAAPSPAAPKPARSGTITGWGITWPASGWGVSTFDGRALDCQSGNPECLAWLTSGCSAALAGRDPAVTASIVDVAKLADGRTARTFAWRAGDPVGPAAGGVVVQLWRKDCTEIRASKWRSALWGRSSLSANRHHATFVIPRDAAWMTVTTNDTANLRWTLR